jgi:hypothetical protein
VLRFRLVRAFVTGFAPWDGAPRISAAVSGMVFVGRLQLKEI